MYNSHPASESAHTTFPHANAPRPQLSWLVQWDIEAERRARLFRHPREEEELLLMRRPIPTHEAFARFGLLLGTFVPAAFFYRMFNYGRGAQASEGEQVVVILFILAMNLICCLIGRLMGKVIGRRIDSYERGSWWLMLAYALCVGAFWGVVTGAAGGLLVFVIGALVGAFVAVPFGIAGFMLFTPLHRLMSRGGMIDARHFWPLACGVVFVITAWVLSPNL